MAGGWNASKKFRYQAKWMNKHLTKVERAIRNRLASQVKVFTPEEIREYAEARGLDVSPELREGSSDD